MAMNCEATIRFVFADASTAARVHGAVHADDDAFCSTRLNGSTLEATLRGDSPRSLLRSIDDLLACASVAEDVINEPDIAADDAGH
jgi:hypothetical protein